MTIITIEELNLANMKQEIKIGDDVFTFYENITELPIKRYQLLQKYILIDAGIGSSLSDTMKHFNKIDQFIEVNDIESVAIEKENMLMGYNFILSDEFISSYTFASLIKTKNGEVLDINDDNIEELVDLLECSSISVGEITGLVELQKKSLMNN